jgi:radical SAM superfamily enzyme YgiQ (UPF0313 family)
VDGVRFTRQGRCQEREDVLGTTKPPLSLAWIASVLRADGHAARVVDFTADAVTMDEVLADPARIAVDGAPPSLVIFASTFPTWDADARAMIALRARTGAPVVAFGPHASCAPMEALARADVDGLLVGEPEDAARQLAALGAGDDWSAVPSLAFRRAGAIVAHRESGRFAAFTDAVGPDWRDVDFARYRLPLVNAPYALVETSRGCPYTCDFCVAPIQQGHQFRERSPKRVIDEVRRLVAERGVRFVYFWGDTVTLNKRSLAEIANGLIDARLGVQWVANARADNLTDPEFVRTLAASGCWMLSFGIEAADPVRRNAMQKRLADEPIVAAVRHLSANGIRSFGFFILGYPTDTPASMAATARYARTLGLDFAGFYPAVPYPGTQLGSLAATAGWIEAPEDWSRLEYARYAMRTSMLDERRVMRAIARARRRFYLRPAYLARHAADLARVAWSKPSITAAVARQFFSR